jgi:nicotinamidase-related amidase
MTSETSSRGGPRAIVLAALLAEILAGACLRLAQASEATSQMTRAPAKGRDADVLRLHTRRRKEIKGKPYQTRIQIVRETAEWNPSRTAIIVIDMWAEHPCKTAQVRVGEIAPGVSTVLAEARRRGVLIVHAPSGGAQYYKDRRYRARIEAAPPAPEPFKIDAWRYLDPKREPPLPIDDRDGGCDDSVLPDMSVPADRHIHPAITVGDGDVVSERGSEIYRLFKREGIENVVVMGVHTNMCVLGRPFGIRNLVDLGFNVVLARDLTDALYAPRSRPHVSHEQGTQLVIEHIEEYWCPTILGYDLIE